ncbi:MAG: AMP-binding protein [Acidobacteriia bacterium]|nr:AMP-binding protein [Terriglobia bacterium]
MESYARGPRGTVLSKSISEAFLDTASRFPGRLAVVAREPGIRLTWAQYAHEAQRAAAGLRALGLAPGDRAGVWATNCLEWVLLQFGCALAGAVLVNVNPAYRSHELAFVLRQSRIKTLFLREQDRRSNYRAILEESRAGQPLALEHVIYLDSPAWTNFLREPGEPPASPDPAAPANIQYTSGTTGQPKGVLLTHLNLVNNGRFIAQYLRLGEEDRIALPVPLFHCFGSVIGTMAAAVTGAAVVLPSAIFDAGATLEAIERERCTAVYGVPAMFIAELQHAEFARFDLRSLRTGVMAGAPCPIEVMKRVVRDMHCPEIVVAYGQTESAPVITMSRTDDSVETRCTTVGGPLPETEVRIASPSTGATLPAGEQGELLARGYMVMKGYDEEPAATAAAIDAEGWLHTGDLAVMRPDGYFRITGRARDMIIRGGENIYPREIEEFLYSHPKISDVQIVGLPDERLGETVLAWIRLKPGETADEEEIRAFCRARLAHYKVPQHIRFVDAFPMTLSGKVQKYRIRQHEIAERGLEKSAGAETA